MTLRESLASRRGYFALSLAVLALDQATKLAADAWLRGKGPVAVVPGFLNLWHSTNRGGLFGMLATWDDPFRFLLLTVLPFAVAVGIAVFLARTEESSKAALAGLGLILGGALGNLLDRAFRGEVVDFVDAYVSHAGLALWLSDRFGTAHWPTFNVADSAIVVGAGLLILDLLRPGDRASGRNEERGPAPTE